MIVLSMLVQIAAASIPAEKSLAASSNHIINGVQTKKDILRAWDAKGSDIPKIYGKFGVTRKDITQLTDKPNKTIKSNGSNYWSIGRNSLSGYSGIDSKFKKDEIAVNTGGPTVYMRPLRAWDTNVQYSTYAAFQGKNSTTGETFWILADCGNYTQNGKGKLPPPSLDVKKTIVGKKKVVRAGDTVKFRIEYRNTKPDSLAEGVKIVDKLQRNKFDVIAPKNAKIGKDDTLEQSVGNLAYTKQSHIYDIDVRVKSNLKGGTQICNAVKLTSDNAPTVNSGDISKTCVVVEVPEQPLPPPPDTPDTPGPPALSKTVKNITQNLSGDEAINSTVKPGDELEYSLITFNSQSTPAANFEISDFIGDILDYADLDNGFLAQQGGSFDDANKKVVWANQTLNAGEDNLKTFRVKIKNPIPSTNSPSTVSTGFDCVISNEYGNEISMNVECPILKSVETLPNTGPGTAVAISVGLTSFSGYFLARNNLLSKELLFILKNKYTSSGGV